MNINKLTILKVIEKQYQRMLNPNFIILIKYTLWYLLDNQMTKLSSRVVALLKVSCENSATILWFKVLIEERCFAQGALHG